MSLPNAEDVAAVAPPAPPPNGAAQDDAEHHHVFVSQVASLPIVAEAYTFASGKVRSLAERYALARTVVNATTAVVGRAAKAAEPFQERFAPQISKIDQTADKALGAVKQKFPIITQHPAEVVAAAKDAAGHLKSSVAASKPVTSTSASVKKVEAVFAAVLGNVEAVVDRILPEPEKAVKVNNVVVTNGSHASTDGNITRVVNLVLDVKRRIARRVGQKAKFLRGRAPETAKDEVGRMKDSIYATAAVERVRSLASKLAALTVATCKNVASLSAACTQRVRAVDDRYGVSRRVDPFWRYPVHGGIAVAQRVWSLWQRPIYWAKGLAMRAHARIPEVRMPVQVCRRGGDAAPAEVVQPKEDENKEVVESSNADSAPAVAAA